MIDLIRQIINLHVKEASPWGIKIAHVAWGAITDSSGTYSISCNNECCPLGAVLLGRKNIKGHQHDVAKVLNVDIDWVDSFTDGFDNSNKKEWHISEAYNLGKEFRIKYIN